MKKKFFLGANWKMNATPAAALVAGSPYHATDPTVVVFPMVTEIEKCKKAGLTVGAQCGHAKASGAFTGDIPMQTLKDLGCTYVLCGHSERRQYHGETDDSVAEQVIAASTLGLIPILCIGEKADERAAGKTHDVLKRQLSCLLSHSQFSIINSQFLIAYEPVWAISGGDPNKPAATTEDAESAHRFIRSLLPKELQSTPILYGGSMKASNAKELLAQPNIDGGLIGGASLKPEDFGTIVEAAA